MTIRKRGPDGCPVASLLGNAAVDSGRSKIRIPDKFLSHPGGQSTLEMARGSSRPDILFLSYHLGHDLDGRITSVCKKMGVDIPKRGPMYDEMSAAVQKIKAEHPEQHWIYVAYCIFVSVAIPVFLVKWIMAPTVLKSLFMAYLFVTYAFNIFHMRHHKGSNLYGDNWFSRVTAPYYDFLDNVYNIRPENWIDNHQASHHLFTNSFDLDYDVNSPFPFFRLHPTQELKWFHKYQYIYAPILFCGLAFTFAIQNVTTFKGPKWAFFVWLMTVAVLPCWLHGLVGFAHFMITFMISGLFITYLFQVSHNHVELREKREDYESLGIDGWVAMQCEESMSWGGYLAGLVFGGINFQTEHHVCPAHDSTLYYFISPELRRICKKYRVTYTREPDFPRAVLAYHKWLHKMGR